MKNSNSWIVEGIVFGIFILIINVLIDVYYGNFALEHIWAKIIISLIGGLVYGLIMKLVKNKINKQ